MLLAAVVLLSFASNVRTFAEANVLLISEQCICSYVFSRVPTQAVNCLIELSAAISSLAGQDVWYCDGLEVSVGPNTLPRMCQDYKCIELFAGELG